MSDDEREAAARGFAQVLSVLDEDAQQDLLLRTIDYLGPNVQKQIMTGIHLMTVDR